MIYSHSRLELAIIWASLFSNSHTTVLLMRLLRLMRQLRRPTHPPHSAAMQRKRKGPFH